MLLSFQSCVVQHKLENKSNFWIRLLESWLEVVVMWFLVVCFMFGFLKFVINVLFCCFLFSLLLWQSLYLCFIIMVIILSCFEALIWLLFGVHDNCQSVRKTIIVWFYVSNMVENFTLSHHRIICFRLNFLLKSY